MKKMIFGATCVFGGLMVAFLLLFNGAFPNAFGYLNFFGKAVFYAGLITAVIGFVLCLFNLRDDDNGDDDDGTDGEEE